MEGNENNQNLQERLDEAQNNNQFRNDSDVNNRNALMNGARRYDSSLTSGLNSIKPSVNEQGVQSNSQLNKQGNQGNSNQLNTQSNNNQSVTNSNSGLSNQGSVKGSNLVSGLPGTGNSLRKPNNSNLNLKQQIAKQGIKTAANTVGLGGIANSKIGDKILNNKLQNKSLFNGLMGAGLGLGNKKDEENKDENNPEKSEEKEEGRFESVTGVVSKRVLKWTAIIGIPCALIVFGCCIILATAQSYVSILGIDLSSSINTDAEDVQNKLTGGESVLENDNVEQLITETSDEAYLDIYDEKSYNMGINVHLVARTHEANFDDLSDYYSTQKVCRNNTSDCRSGAEYKFYLKMYDLYYLYRNKYKVKLDLPLIMSTLFYNNDQMSTVLKMNLSDYDRKTIVESDWNPTTTTELDWDYDYESKYNYLVSNDSSMDMQVLAKNMVSKTTTQKCVKDGNIVKSEKIKDTEDDLVCGEGETLEKGESTYELDLDKYDEFLLEYIEKKYYLNRSVDNPVVSNGPDYVSSKYPSGSTSSSSSGSDSSGTSQQVSPTGTAVIDQLNSIALGEVGNKGTKYRTWFNGFETSDEWCAMFVSWLFNQVGGINKYIKKYAGAGDIPRYSVPAGYGVWYEDECSDSSTTPKAGDVILFTPTIFPQDKYTSRHVGYVYKVDNEKVYTVEGNTGTWDSNTSSVMTHEYDRKNCTINGYFRPNY